jgi:hypothetical protein
LGIGGGLNLSHTQTSPTGHQRERYKKQPAEKKTDVLGKAIGCVGVYKDKGSRPVSSARAAETKTTKTKTLTYKRL